MNGYRSLGLTPVIGLTILLGMAVACSAAPDTVEDLEPAKTTSAITRGILVPEGIGAPDTSAVKMGGCSGIKIGSRRFLTAAHCHFENVSSFTVTNSLDGTSGAVTLTITAATPHPTSVSVPSDNLYQDFMMVDVAETSPSIPVYNVFRPSRVNQDVQAAVTSYGCDLASSNGGQKQYAYFTTQFNDEQLGFDLTWMYAPGDPLPAICPGDSGGPLWVLNNNTWETAGLVSFGDGNTQSWFSRVSSVFAWLQDPRFNVLASGRKGFLLNKASNKALATDSPSGPPKLGIWDGRTHSTGIDPQYWKLTRGGVGFQLTNTKSNRCLANPFSGTVSELSCSSNSSQFWQFQSLSSRYYQLRNVQSGRCLSVLGTAPSSQAETRSCVATDNQQRWLFSN